MAYKEMQWEQYKVAWSKSQGSPRADRVLPPSEFRLFLDSFDFSMPPTIECTLLS